MRQPGADTVLVRHADVGVKSGKVQAEMERRLRDNIEAVVRDRGIDAEVERRWSRILLHADSDDIDAAADAAADTFGVRSASPAAIVPPEKGPIVDALARSADANADAVGDTFAVRARRAGNPDVVALVSGGIDSPVAAWEMMKRGAPIVPVYLELGDYGGPDHEARAMETVRRLADFAPNFDMNVRKVPAGDVMDLLAEEVGPARMLVYRRFMYRVAEHVARETNSSGIVTGEAIGQKSSQTARNLGATSQAADLPIHRPLLTMDKSEITERARDIGTFRDSTIPAGCNRIAPDYPETNATLEIVENAEPDDLFERAERAARDATIVNI